MSLRDQISEWPGRMKVLTAQQMRDLDRRATEQYGIPSLLLMENAGRAVADAAIEMLEETDHRRVLIVAGPGNNGGDGFVTARHLHNAGVSVRIAYFGDRGRARGDALASIEIAEKMGLEIDSSRDLDVLRDTAMESDLTIDALLGTGTRGELSEEMAAVIGCMNLNSHMRILAVDIPSGVDADTGAPLGPPLDKQHILQQAVNATATVTFGLPKIGLVTYPGAAQAGDLRVADIGIPIEALDENDSRVELIGPELFMLLSRDGDCNKGNFGHLAVVAGSVGMTGAATLAAEGALRIGTGLVTLLVPESLNDIMEVKVTEAMTIPVPLGKARAFGMASLDRVLEYVAKWDAAVIGPGFGRDEDTVEFTLELVKRLEKPAIIDADALFAISKDLGVLKECKAPIVITPHPGEMATLLGTSAAEVQSNRLDVARSFAQEHGVTVALKGAGTVVAAPEGEAFINITGTAGMATGGTGDVLSGMIGGLLAQWCEPGSPMEPSDAACAAVYLHGRAGELAAEELGEVAMIASDVANHIGKAIQEASVE